MNDPNNDAFTIPIGIMLYIERMIIIKLMFNYFRCTIYYEFWWVSM